jgi:transcriptional regulator with GAF, ATPase, and Fis domain
MLRDSPTALFVLSNSTMQSRHRSDKLNSRWVLYESSLFQPELLTNQLRDKIGTIKAQHIHTKAQDLLSKMVGECDQIKRLRESIWKYAQHDTTVLCVGESGTGKDLTAELLHECGPRRSKPFRTVSCPGIMESVWDAELNGHVRGSFTGATRDRAGRIESANGGTVFLDEIGEINNNLQAKLLDFLQHRRITKVGSNEARQVDVRVIAATNKDLKRARQKGEFREDLYYRLAQVVLEIPPLRKRGKDAVLLANHFVAEHGKRQGREFSLHKKTEAFISKLQFPGNVRQLRDLVNLAILNCGEAEAVLLPEHFR